MWSPLLDTFSKSASNLGPSFKASGSESTYVAKMVSSNLKRKASKVQEKFSWKSGFDGLEKFFDHLGPVKKFRHDASWRNGVTNYLSFGVEDSLGLRILGGVAMVNLGMVGQVNLRQKCRLNSNKCQQTWVTSKDVFTTPKRESPHNMPLILGGIGYESPSFRGNHRKSTYWCRDPTWAFGQTSCCKIFIMFFSPLSLKLEWKADVWKKHLGWNRNNNKKSMFQNLVESSPWCSYLVLGFTSKTYTYLYVYIYNISNSRISYEFSLLKAFKANQTKNRKLPPAKNVYSEA